MSKPEQKDIASEAVALTAHIKSEGELTDEDVAKLEELRALLDQHLPPRKDSRPGITRVSFGG